MRFAGCARLLQLEARLNPAPLIAELTPGPGLLSFGADVPLGANLVLSAGYASSKTDGAERLSGLGLGVAYSLSKRTTVYGGFLDTKNVGPDTRYGFGLKHTF